jgi:hypothetical protein
MFQRWHKDARRDPDHTSTLDALTTWAAFANARTSWARPKRCSSGHCKDTKRGLDHTATLDTVKNLGGL